MQMIEYKRRLNFAIVDEVDSILIDEARTPLIIAGNGEDESKICALANAFILTIEDGDFEMDKKIRLYLLQKKDLINVKSFLV